MAFFFFMDYQFSVSKCYRVYSILHSVIIIIVSFFCTHILSNPLFKPTCTVKITTFCVKRADLLARHR